MSGIEWKVCLYYYWFIYDCTQQVLVFPYWHLRDDRRQCFWVTERNLLVYETNRCFARWVIECCNKSFFFFLRLECCHLKIVSDICPQVWMTIANITIFTFWSNFFFQKYVRHVVLITMSFPEFYMYVTPYLVRQIVHSSWFLISIRHIGWTAALHAHVPRMVHGSRQT